MSTDQAPAVVTVTAPESFDVYDAPGVREELMSHHDAPLLLLDLTPTAFMDNIGLGMAVGAHKRAREAGRKFGVICSDERVLKLFRITGLTKVLDIRDSAEAFTEGEGRDGA